MEFLNPQIVKLAKNPDFLKNAFSKKFTIKTIEGQENIKNKSKKMFNYNNNYSGNYRNGSGNHQSQGGNIPQQNTLMDRISYQQGQNYQNSAPMQQNYIQMNAILNNYSICYSLIQRWQNINFNYNPGIDL